MKMLTDVKIYIVSYFKNLSRERIAIFICIPLSLVALSICALMLLFSNQKTPKPPDEAVFVTEAPTEKRTYPPDSPYGIKFESLGNGCCAVVGIGDFKGKELKIPHESPFGEPVIEISSNAFKNCDTIEAISIPSSVERIGDGAFRGCSSLAYIDVAIDNEVFTSLSGVLFSKSRTQLIFYPPSRADRKYYINPNVKVINDYAFEGAKNISVILYSKSTAEFESISIGKVNDILKALPITCNYAGENSGK